MKAEEVHGHIGMMNAKVNEIIGKKTQGVHFGGYRELLAAVASIEEFYDLSYAPKTEERRSDIMNIMINAVLEEQSTDQIYQSLKNKGLADEDASKVASTEEQRIRNLASWYQYYGGGYKFFSAQCENKVCEKCKEAYKDDKKYPIEQLNMLPPLDGECKCDLMFYRK
ncbi:hypothetical protein [Methanobacterium sp. ACI-7]|uniref:hypothetical protein n=1 Tax=unclassified Methanobacterium TaxID=2627676 RepID=UPI0039C237E9